MKKLQMFTAGLCLLTVVSCQTKQGTGTLVGTGAGAVVGGIKPGEDGGAVVRLYDVCGRGGRFLLTLAAPVTAAKEVDITERDTIGRPLTAAGNTVSGELMPYEIRTLHLTFAG